MSILKRKKLIQSAGMVLPEQDSDVIKSSGTSLQTRDLEPGRRRPMSLWGLIFPGIGECTPQKDDFGYCRDNASTAEWAWMRKRVQERVEEQKKSERTYVFCSKCKYRGIAPFIIVGEPCRRCGQSYDFYEGKSTGGILKQMDAEQIAKFKADEIRYQKEFAAKQAEAKEAERVYNLAKYGPAALKQVPNYPEAPKPTKAKVKNESKKTNR